MSIKALPIEDTDIQQLREEAAKNYRDCGTHNSKHTVLLIEILARLISIDNSLPVD